MNEINGSTSLNDDIQIFLQKWQEFIDTIEALVESMNALNALSALSEAHPAVQTASDKKPYGLGHSTRRSELHLIIARHRIRQHTAATGQ